MTTSFTQLAAPTQAEIVEKRSRFLAQLSPAASEDQARAFIESVRASHSDARHHCTAFILGPRGHTRRSNDDGEPSGTAGAPMLEALACAVAGEPLTNTVAVVTRWFGGILLGAGGLVRAYGDAVRSALDSAAYSTFTRTALWRFTVGHAQGPKVENVLRTQGVDMRETAYTADGVTLVVGALDKQALHGLLSATVGEDVSLADAGQAWVQTSPPTG